ncbi:hypothetical protein QWJ34_11050 [Saccharibacillus sp. CPCC 101409]|uniref:hypothetical protein n=1 Tax=Saccharibacillus sp. CPCC 101409 TaxID=3058041 RepID=UPI0026726A15|nr:hypothetical protein [Saccharibacillus sp. CPCC 101409]MDO3410299.1 hypothetical protein [Saccharibacillus sp. CPCC 101409]
MKTYNRAASLLGVLLLSGALAACGNESDSASQTQPADTAATDTDNANKDAAGGESSAIEEPATAEPDKAADADKEEGSDAGKSAETSGEDKGGAQAEGDSEKKADDFAAKQKQADASKQGDKGAGADRSKSDKIQVVGGSAEEASAKLAEGYGYSLYVPEGFEFDADSNTLSSKDDAQLYAVIQPLEEGYAIASLRKQGEKELKTYGETSEVKGGDLPELLNFSQLALKAEQDGTTYEYMLWETVDKGYILRIHVPEQSASADPEALLYAALSTIGD